MMNKTLILLFLLVVILTTKSTAQLSDNAINEITAAHVDKWSQYLNLSKYRKAKLSKAWKQHEKNKGTLLHSPQDLKNRLKNEKQRFISELSTILSANELKVYTMFEQFNLEDDREYLESILEAVSNDSIFLSAYTDLQYSKVFPFNMIVRMELEESISQADKVILDSVRNEVLGMYDKCLLTCLVKDHDTSQQFEDFDDLLIVELNKELSDNTSSIYKLVNLTNKYEDRIHEVFINHKDKFDYWDKVTKELKSQYILESHNESLRDLRKRNNYATLKHIESEAIFLLLDPYDKHLSRKLYNLKLYNQL